MNRSKLWLVPVLLLFAVAIYTANKEDIREYKEVMAKKYVITSRVHDKYVVYAVKLSGKYRGDYIMYFKDFQQAIAYRDSINKMIGTEVK